MVDRSRAVQMQSRFNSLASEQESQHEETNMLPNAEHLNRKLEAVAAAGAAMITEEDLMERRMILNIIYANDYYSLMNNKRLVTDKNLNWLEAHPKTDLDELITPLTCAAFLGRANIVELLLQNESIDLEMATVENEYTALMAACMASKLLEPNSMNTLHSDSKT